MNKKFIRYLILVLSITILFTGFLFAYQYCVPGITVGSEAPEFDTFDTELNAISNFTINENGIGVMIFVDDPTDSNKFSYFNDLSDGYMQLVTINAKITIISRKSSDLLNKLRSKTRTYIPYISDLYLDLIKSYNAKHRLTDTVINTTVMIDTNNKVVFYQRGLLPFKKVLEIAKQLSSNK